MIDYVSKGQLSVAKVLADFVDQEALPGTGVESAAFWEGLAHIIATLAPENRALLAKRETLQGEIDAWHRANRGRPHDPAAYRAFLEGIGYLLPEGQDFTIETTGVDAEIATMAGPQLVVPVSSARMSLNAANARWGSLYDALYVSDAIPEDGGAARGASFNPVRGAKVVAQVQGWLDAFLPIENLKGPRSHGEVLAYTIEVGTLLFDVGATEPRAYLSDSAQFLGYQGDPLNPSAILFEHNGLGIELRFDRSNPVGAAHPAGLADVHVEAALTTIVDFEDATAAVDPDDKVACYRNWLGLMKGMLEATGYSPIDLELEERLGMSLAELNLSVRATNCLESEGINTVRDLVTRTDDQLLQVRNFGETTLLEVKERLQTIGLRLGMKVPQHARG
jgi:malate synthase